MDNGSHIQTEQKKKSNLKGWLFIAAALAIIIVIIVRAKPAITWQYNYQEGMKLAQEQNKAVLILFDSAAAEHGRRIRVICESPEGAAIINKYFIPIDINGDVETALVARYTITSFPTCVLQWPNNDETEAFGFTGKKYFIPKLQRFIEKSKPSSH